MLLASLLLLTLLGSLASLRLLKPLTVPAPRLLFYVNVIAASLLVSLLCYMSLLLPVALLSLTFSIATTAGVLLAVGVNDVTVIEIAGAADIPNLKVFNTSA